MIKEGTPPYQECSSRGDKRFSAFYATLDLCDNKSIETIYQAAKIFKNNVTGLSIKDAKGRQPLNHAYTSALYSLLWDLYILENPILLKVLKNASGLSDIFGQPGSVCQATELWRIRCQAIKK